MKVLYFGSYSLNNSRNAVLIKGLRLNGVEVIECCDNSPLFAVRCWRLLVKYFTLRATFDVMIVGFPGQELMPLARLLTRKPIVFDVFTSHYMGYILDRQYFSPQSLRAWYYHTLDALSCRLADSVLLDTQSHIDYFVKEFKIPSRRFVKIWLGANTDVYYPLEQHQGEVDSSEVVFWGNFIPLQGVEVIVRAAYILKNEAIHFTLMGKGQTLEKCKELSRELQLTNITFLGFVSYEELRQRSAQAHISLGVFSSGVKADITIQNKIFEALAMGKALITARTTATQELLRDGENCILCNPSDAESLARAILKLKADDTLRHRIAKQGHDFFLSNLTEQRLGAELKKTIEALT